MRKEKIKSIQTELNVNQVLPQLQTRRRSPAVNLQVHSSITGQDHSETGRPQFPRLSLGPPEAEHFTVNATSTGGKIRGRRNGKNMNHVY